MNPDRLRWTDSRLDDRFDTVTGELRALRDVPQTLGRFEEKLSNLRKDMDGCFAAMRDHRDDFSAYVEEQERTHEAHRIERKTDRRWMIGTVLTTGALIIAAVGIIVGQLG